ncbi:TonB-dependent receptor [bacterium SCSIO 12643]|nr:TonB-dependent receptor [bacterium SCSIO 12643]
MTLTGKIFTICMMALTLIFSGQAKAQGSLSGVIKDAGTKETLIGATVMIVGTYKGTATDIDGKYTITDIKPGDYSIKVSFIGYADKVFNGIHIANGETTTLNAELSPRSQTLKAVEIVGEKNLIDLEAASSEVKISQEALSEMNARDVTEVASMQAGVNKTTDGISIRGGRVYETQYVVDGISVEDPLAGTGAGVSVASSSIQDIQITTGGSGADQAGGMAGVISTKIREGGDKFEIGGSWTRDNLGFDRDAAHSWNTDIFNLNFGGAFPFTKKKLRYFFSIDANLTDDYFGPTANQLHSSLLPSNDSIWAPRYNNSYSNTIKLVYEVKPGTKFFITNQHSLKINQNSRTLQIVGFDQVLAPGFQYRRSLNLDNATTYTQQSNLTVLNFNHFFNNNWSVNASLGRLFTNLRADANGRPFRTETVDQILDEDDIVTNPVGIFNPGDPIVFTQPGPWLINNGGISGTWHDHYVQDYTIKAKVGYYPDNKTHRYSFGFEHHFLEYQWTDVDKPWVGAPIVINDTLTTPSTSVGVTSDIWKVKPSNGALFAQDVITYKGIVATIGLRLNYWSQGTYIDDVVNDPNSPVVDQIREDYMNETFGMFGKRFKARLLPKINVSFPVTDNNVLYFNYGHFMRLPHPRFVYQGLDLRYQQNSFLSSLGNPNLNPEVSVNYELGMKSQITKDLAMSIAAFNNNRFDYIVSRRVIVKDQTGRPVSKSMYINQDYARIYGIEFSIFWRPAKHFRTSFNVAYQVARGKSNSARESGLQIEQNGQVALTKEQYLAWDRPWDIKWNLVFKPDTSMKVLHGFTAFTTMRYSSGYRYTPQVQVGTNALGRPLYEPDLDQYLAKSGKAWFNADLKLSYQITTGKEKKSGLIFSFEIRNLFNNKNAQTVNPITGRGYEPGDDVTSKYRDERYLGPEENGELPDDPARYLAPRQFLYGISFKF